MTPADRAEILELENEELRRQLGISQDIERVDRARLSLKARPGAVRVILALIDKPGRIVSHVTLYDCARIGLEADPKRCLQVTVCHARTSLSKAGIKPEITCTWGSGYSISPSCASLVKKLIGED